jgi:hypothetical protein
MDFEFIDENEIESVKRGRKSTVSPELVEAFRKVPTGKAVKITALAGDPSDAEAYKLHKASASATIRSAGTQAGKKVKISWSSAGVPQVVLSTPKPAKSK